MNSFGRLFRISIFGESHGEAVGVTLDGVPAGLELDETSFEKDLGRRKSGKRGTTPRKESDTPHLLTGVFNGRTTGAPLTVIAMPSSVRARSGATLPSPMPATMQSPTHNVSRRSNRFMGGAGVVIAPS